MIKIRDVIHRYTIWESETKKNKKTVLDGISLDIPSGQFIAILGPNGSGKSTLAKHLNALLLPDEGSVWIDDKNTDAIENLDAIREQVGMVFQNPDNQIVGTSVEEDVAFGPENRNLPSEEIQKEVTECLTEVNLLHKRKVSPSRLSGGQKQKVAIAGALAGHPKNIVLDEPTAMLDPESRNEVIKIIRRLNQELGITVILITHHTEEVVEADMIVLMNAGKVVRTGTPEEIFADTELLRSVKMDVPQITELADGLRKKGVELPNPILTEEQFIREIKRVFGQEQKKVTLKMPEYICQSPEIMKVDHISYTYGKGTVNELKVLKDITFSIHEGEFIGLIGSSGAGKTTLIKHLNGLLKADGGHIFYGTQDIYDKKYRLSQLRKEVGLVFQYPEQQLFGRTVLADVSYGPMNMGMSRKEAEESARECLRLVGIDESYDYNSPFDLSGGQMRCVAIAGVLAMNPRILIMDEPAAGLDPETKKEVFRLLHKIREERNITVMVVSHDMEDVAKYMERVMVLHEGHIVLDDTPQMVFAETNYLRQIGIGIPQIAALMERLRKEQILDTDIAITVEQAEQLLLMGKEG